MKREDLNYSIMNDLKRYGISQKKPSYLLLRSLYGFHYTKVLRKTKYYKAKGNLFLFIFYRLKLERLSFKYGFQIPYNIKMGEGIYIGHFGTLIINEKAELGNNINLSPGVTIGMTNRGKKKGFPIIGDNVWIGTNAILVGKINVGNDVLIAPNSYVNFDIPDHSIVIGNPAVIHPKTNATDYYVENKVNLSIERGMNEN